MTSDRRTAHVRARWFDSLHEIYMFLLRMRLTTAQPTIEILISKIQQLTGSTRWPRHSKPFPNYQ